MKIIIIEDYEELSAKAAEIMLAVVKNNPYAVLGLATGTTPLGLYGKMIEDFKANGTSYKNMTCVNLDEYVGLDKNHTQSYAYFMRKNLFDWLDINPEHTHIENGVAADAEEECRRYDSLLKKHRQDIQLLGLGSNGHIAFNEPGTAFGLGTHLVKLAPSTVRDNARLFDSEKDVPLSAFTVGPANIMNAKKILILASGAKKAEAVYGAVRGTVTESLPASILQRHGDCTLIADRQAAALL